MFSPLRGVLALIAMSGLTLFGTPAFAVEPDTNSPAGPELPAPRVRPDFQMDDQAGATKLVPQVELAPSVVIPDNPVPVPPPLVVPEP